ncbi:MAG: ABC transporter permease [Firmicutes bacterium]|nr:ABC transporter permease [Candidatus Fermentithermobacillaceae bacterium]
MLDFPLLALRELRANSTRVTAALIAVSVAAFSLVAYRAVLSGYPQGFAQEIRALAGGEILIFCGIDLLTPGSGLEMEWRPWKGRPWQSYLEYYLPDLPSRGYLAFPETPEWSPLDPEDIAREIRGIPGVAATIPYYSLPCYVETSEGRFEAILRARNPAFETDLYSMAEYLTDGRLWHEGEEEAIVPISQGKAIAGVRAGETFRLVLPAPGATPGEVDWTRCVEFTLRSSGEYDMSKSLREAAGAGNGAGAPAGGRVPAPQDGPTFEWNRPEIMVTEQVFRSMCTRAGWGEPACYQLAVRVEKMAMLNAVARAIRAVLRGRYAVFTVPELGEIRVAGSPVPVAISDIRLVMLVLTYALSGTIVCGSVYIMISQSRRKIGLLRVVGATSRQIAVYVYSLMLGVFLIGSTIGLVPGECLRFLDWLGSDLPISAFLKAALADAGIAFGAAVAISLVMGTLVVAFASRLPCAEVLARGQV